MFSKRNITIQHFVKEKKNIFTMFYYSKIEDKPISIIVLHSRQLVLVINITKLFKFI